MYDVEDENRFWSKVETSDDKTVCWNVNTSKFNKEQVDEIRHKYATTDTSYGKLAKEYCVHRSHYKFIIYQGC
jgi:hypothetical protein